MGEFGAARMKLFADCHVDMETSTRSHTRVSILVGVPPCIGVTVGKTMIKHMGGRTAKRRSLGYQSRL